jgi:SpoVK/Ycf46/Vps4 family AAA+-type ATPase
LDGVLGDLVERRKRHAPDVLPGIYVSEREVDALLERPSQEVVTESLPSTWGSNQLVTLELRCGLTSFEQATLLLSLASALDQRYGRIYAYLQDDLTQPFATAGLALQLFGGDFEARMQLRSFFEPTSHLRALELVTLAGDESQPLLARALVVPERVVAFLTGREGALPALERRELVLSEAGLAQVHRVAQEWRQAPPAERAVVVITGEPGSGRKLAASTLADSIGRHLVVRGEFSPVAVRDAVFSDAVLCIAGSNRLFEAEDAEERRRFEAALACTDLPVVLTLDHAAPIPGRIGGRRVRLLHLPALGTEERIRIWQQETALAGVSLGEPEAAMLATTYRLSGRDIAATVERASVPDGSSESLLDRLAPAAKLVASSNLGRLGQEIMPRFRWQDIVLPAEVSEQLNEMIIRVRHRPLVFGEWGFTLRHARSSSVSALFAGPSGTGKTMAAEVIANELSLPLYRVDLAAVVSKYIGETEKNLSQIFNEAESSSAVLFFDEADALFGKRSEVKDAHDRYANIEVSYLLQRMEDYDGIIILASNLRQNLDEAFVRRLHLTADFPFPDADARLEIWRRHLPAALPLAADVDLPALARRFRLSGGNIRNACVTAAFLAAAEGSIAGMAHFERAIRREHQKMGKLLLGDEEASR